MKRFIKRILTKRLFVVIVCFQLSVVGCRLQVNAAEPMRRVISPEQPAWIIHIDVWNYADPQKIIDMVPEDVRPFVIFNIATSSSDDKSADGPAIYDSWMKVCAQNRVWTMIQCASGFANRMPDTPDDVSAYEKYFKDYPNFIGFNFAEQYWGFDNEGGVSFDDRLKLFAKLLELSKTYGGYLAVSFADSYHNANKLPVAYIRRNSDINAFLSATPEYFLCFEKYTQKKNFLYNESACLGAWLSGIAGQYGIRFDSSGWVEKGVRPDSNADDAEYTIGASDFVRAAGALPVAEHIMLTGQTVMDGPELIWTECSAEDATNTLDGYTRRNWKWLPQFQNITLDLFRKILDGTIRIMSRDEVMARTKVCVVNGGNGSDNASYRIPAELFDGVYRNGNDYGGLKNVAGNHWLNNRWWTKSTGRYPTIPSMPEAGGLTDIGAYLGNTDSKVAYLNSIFEEEYTGDIFAGRNENGWVTYNPYQYDDVTTDGVRTLSASTRRATGTIPFKYNTCRSMSVDYAPYSLCIVREEPSALNMYLTNYSVDGVVSEDVIRIDGASSQPAVTWQDRGEHSESSVVTDWSDGVCTITVRHNGPLDMRVECSGGETRLESDYTAGSVSAPALPAAYSGMLQYEAELADYLMSKIYKSGYNQGHDGYKGQGFAELNGNGGRLRFSVCVPESGSYMMSVYYQTDADGSLRINDASTAMLPKSASWAVASVILYIEAGRSYLTVQNMGDYALELDCIQLQRMEGHAFSPDENGEYHVPLRYMIPSGSVGYDADTGVVTQVAGGEQSGSLSFVFDNADFTDVLSLKVMYEGDGSIFRCLKITDNMGASVNPDGNQGAFWSSKYNLNYQDYQLSAASRNVCKLEWTAAAPEARSMTITDILITSFVNTATGVVTPVPSDGPCEQQVYSLQGIRMLRPQRGLVIVRKSDGTMVKTIVK